MAFEEAQQRWRKNLFFTIANEGDPVVRADRAFIRSLLELYGTSVPPSSPSGSAPSWPVPPTNFSSAGQLVVIRHAPVSETKRRGFFSFGKTATVRNDEQELLVEAVCATDEALRQVIYGDPQMHSMRLYKRRIEILAAKAVTCT